MKLSEYLKQNGMSTKDYFEMRKRKEEGKTSLSDYQRQLYQEIKSTDLSDIVKSLSSNEFLDQETLTYYNDRVSQVADKVSRFKMGDEESNKSFLENLKSLQSGISKASEYYSTFKDEDAYKSFLKNQKDQEAFKAADLGALESEIGDLEGNYKSYIGIKTKRDNLYSSIVSGYMRAGYGREKAEKTALSDGRIAKYDKELSQYGDMSNSAKSLSEKKQFYNNAKRIQDGIALQENAKNAEDFDKFSKSGADIENPTYDEVTGHLIIPSGVKKIKNKVTYSRDNFEEYQDTASKKRMYIQNENGSKVINGINELYTQMTDEEVAIYNYYLSKEGEEKANQFLDSIIESLNYRQAEIEFEDNFRNNAILEGILGLSAGLDQWASGVESLFNTDGKYVPQSVTQIMGGMAREDLSDDYGIVGQGAYDLINTTGNMLPSILVSTMTGNIAGGLGAGVKAAQTIGKIAGAATLGSSAAGNGYQEMLNLGYDKSQAQAYGTLVGISEAGLEYLLGGISSLGGKFSGGITDTIVTKLVSNMDDAIAKVAIGAGGKLVGSMISEFGEEYLQEVLDPVFKNITLKTDEDIKFFSSEALYSGILGALSAGLLEGSSTISGEVATYKQGKAVKDSGQLSNLKKLGTSFSADTIAYKIASQVDENTDAYTIGQLLHEAGADGLSETNIAEITKSLERKNIAPEHAQTIAKWLNKAVEGGYFTKSQIKALENPDISKTFKDIIVNQNSTVNQRMQSYTDILQNIATEKANQKAEKANAKADKKANSEPQATEKTKTTPFVPYSNEEIAKRQAKGEDVNLLEGKSTPETEKALESKFEVNLEGKTVNVKSGEDVKVSEIASIDNGKMTLKLDNGETVDAEDISFGTEDEAIIYSSVLDMGVNAAIANSLVKNYNPSDKLSAKNYVLGIKEAYKYGAYGMSINEISKKGFAADLSEPQRVHAYNLGKTDMAAKVENAQKEVEKVTSGKGGFEGKVHFNGDTLALKEVQRESLKRMGVLSEVLGVDIHVFESYVENGKRVFKDTDGKVKSAPNGYYKGGKIYIDLNAGRNGQGVMIYTVAHELTHFIREWSPAKFKVLADFLMERYGEKGHNVNDLVQAQIDKAKRNNRTIDFDTAYEEVVADSMEMMLSDDAVYEKILELKSKDASIVKKIGEFFAKIVDSFKKLMQQYPPETPEGKLVSQMNDSFTKLQDLFAEALVDASNNYQANKEQKNTTSEGDVKESRRLGGYFPEVNVSTKDISIFGIKDINNIKEVKQKVYNYLLGKYVSNDKISKPIKNIDTDMDIYVYRGGIDETFGNANAYKNLYTKKKKIKLATMTSLAKLIKYGEVRSPETPNIHNSKSENVYAYLTAPITIDGVEYMVNMDIKKTPSGNRFYVHTIKIADESPKSNNSSTKLTNSSAKDSIPQTSKKSQEKLSGRDSLGNTLTEAQQSYFAESKVRDENGNLKVMYRGDSNEFTVFDRKKTNYANLYGRGFYFTERKEHAEQYGKSREFYLNIKTPLSLKQNNITKSQMLKFLEAIENDGDDYDLYNYGMDATAQSVLNSVWGKGDYEMLQDISASAIGDLVAAIELFNEVNGTTYDGIVLPTETITFESEQAKLTSNKNPTDDKDIRYSDRDKRYQELQTEYNQLKKEVDALKNSEEYTRFVDSLSTLGKEELDNAIKEYGEWSHKSGLFDKTKRMEEIVGEQKDIRAAMEDERKNSRDAYMKSIEELHEMEKLEFVNKAVERYGTTNNVNLASYLMLNGEMLDFSEGQGYRVQDHREISEILDMPDSAGYSDGLIAFMNMGNIRLQTYGIDISKAPNREQREALREVITQIMRNENEFSIDFSKINGYTDGSVTYPRGTSTSKILSDIDSYFKTGVVPEYESTFGEFLYSDRDSSYMDAVNNGDMETAQRLVDDVARENGYRIKGHHGTDVRFTIFNREKTSTANDFGQGFYFSSSEFEAEQYQKDDAFGDTYNKIDGIAYDNALEKIRDMGEDENDDALFTRIYNEEFDKELKRRTDEGAVINAYLKMENPFVVSTSKMITEEEAIEIARNTMYVDDVPNEAAIFDWIHSIKAYAKQHDGKVDTHHFANNMGHSINLTNALLHQGKYDGILDYSIRTKFGSTSDYHAIALYPNKIKDSSPVTYDDNGNVIPLSERFNAENEDIRYSDRDSEGNTLTKEQQEFFKDSKVRDAEGNLLVCYHGTDAEFTTFDADFISRDNKLGFGFYFMAGKKLQYSYKNPLKTYLNITNPITDTSKKLTKETLIEFCNKFGIEFDYDSGDYDLDVYERLSYSYTGETKDFLQGVISILGVDGVLSKDRDVAVAFSPEQIKETSNTNPTSDPDIRYSERVTDEETLDFLNEQIEKGEYIKVYRSFQVIDGGLYAPMNAVDRDENGKNKRLGYRSEYGVWEKSTESPEIAQRYMENHPEAPYAKFDLDGVDNKTNAVAYNPYLHASNLVLNDQFAAAYRRNLITVECYVPLSEADGTYKAQYAKDATGWVDWKAGGVAGKLLKVKPEYTRKLFVSRYMLPVRQVPDSEVAAMYKEYLDGTDIAVPWNVVTPSLRKELEKAGVSISYDDVKAGSKTVSFNDVFSDEVKLSDRDSKTAEDIKKINKQLARENVKLIEDVKYLKELVKLQSKETHGKMLKKSTVELVAKRLMAYANAKGDISELVGHLSDVYSYIIQGEDVSWETIKEKSQAAVDWLMSNEYYKPVRNEEANEILKHLRNTRVSLSESQKKEVAYRYESYNEYRKRNMGRIILTNDGVRLDSVWQELAELFPGHFDNEVSEGDQPIVLMEKIDGLQNAYEVDDHHYYSDEMIAQDLLTKIYDGYWDVSALHTVADAKQKEINLLKAKHKERMDELRQSHEESDAKLRQEHRERVSQLRTQYREREEAKVRKVAEYYQKSRKDAVERVKETREKREAVTKLQRIVLDTAKWVSYPKKDDVKCPDIIRGPYAEFLSSIDLSSKRLLSGGEPTQNDLRVSSAMDSLAKAIEKKLGTQSPDTETETVLDTGYLDLPVHFVENLKEMAENLKKRMAIDGHVVNSMTSEEVKALTKFIRTLNHSIKEMSTLYSNMRFARVEQLGNDSMLFLKDLGEAKQTNSIANFVTWDNALPYYTFKRFGVAGESVFEELMDAQDKLAYLAAEIFKFKDKTWTDKEASEWSKDTHTIELPSGRKLTLTSADAMSIYCLSRREQGRQHLLGGGVRVVGIEKNGKKANDSRSLLNQQDLLAIASSLTKKQMQVAEAIQEYMSTVCADWGNEISMKRFLTKEFTEKFYFPIESNDENLDTKDPKAQQSDLYRLLNISATKPLTKGANNEVIIRNVFDVFTNHSSDMAKLNAYGMALLDYMKWINYREKTVNDDGQISVSGVRKSMERAYGPEAKKYVIGLIKDINGRANDGGDHPWLMKMTRMAKTAMVGANLRVSLLQFTAYPRAAMVLSNRSLTLGLTKVPQIEKAKKYCGIALWKSFGFYDTNISRSIEDQIKGTTNIRQKLIELSLKGAEWGDAITWGCLWNACEYEVAKTKQYKVGSEEFNQAVGKKLRDVVYATQVVDSTLTRSQMMRNKSGLTQSASAFMSEPTLSANILMDAGFQFNLEKRRTGSAKLAWQKTGKYIGKTVAVYSIGQIIVALAEALADAYRDDDDEEFIAKYGEAFTKNVISDLNPFNKLPIIADVSDLIMSWFGIGFSSSNSLYLQAIDEASNAFEIWSKVINGEDGKTVYSGIYSTTKLISYITGISASGAMREVVTLWNNTAGAADPYLKIRTYESSATDKGIAEYKFDKGDAASVKTTVSKMVEDKMKSGKTEKEAKSAVRSSFTSSYKPEYIAAVKSRDYDEMNRIRKFLYSTGLYGSLSELDETLKKWRTAE